MFDGVNVDGKLKLENELADETQLAMPQRIAGGVSASAAAYNSDRSFGTSPNFLMSFASLNCPVAGSPVRLNATAPA